MNWLTLIGQGLGQIINLAGKLFNLIWKGEGVWFTIDDTVKKTARSMGLCKEQADGIRKVVIQSQIDLGAVYGMTMKDIKTQMDAFHKATNRANVISADVIKNFGVMSKLLDDGGEAVGDMSKELNDLGGNIRNADAYLGAAFKQAQKYGLNASKSASSMAKNMKNMSAMRFRNGVSDLTRMSILTDKMNVDFGNMANAVSKFDTLEGAIQNSAQIAMMGGNLGSSFSNPLAMMSMAQTDNAAFMENIMDSVKGLATWDNKNHMAQLDWMSQQKIKAMSQATGIGEEDLRKMSLQTARENQMTAQLGSSTMNELKKAGLDEYIKTLGYQDTDGRWKIDNPDGSGAMDIKTLLQNNNADELKEIFKHVPTDDINKNVGVIEQDVKSIRDFLDGTLKPNLSVKEHVEGGASSLVGGINAVIGEPVGNLLTDAVNGLVQQAGTGGGTMDLIDNLYGGLMNSIPNAIRWMFPDAMLNWKPSSIVKGTLGIEGHARGGIVGGNSQSGDKVLAGLNSGEMVLNKPQQANLFALANGAFTYAKGMAQEGVGSVLNLTAHYSNAKPAIDSTRNGLKKVFDDFSKNQKEAFTKLVKTQKEAFAQTSVGKNIKSVKNAITTKPKAMIDSVKTGLGRAKDVITAKPKALITAAKNTNIFKFLETSVNNVGKLFNTLTSPIQKFGKAIAHPLKTTKKIFGKVGDKIMNSSIGKSIAQKFGGKAATSVGGRLAKTVLKKVPVVGTLISAAGGIMDAVGASNVYEGKKQMIEERTDLSKSQKKQMLRNAEDERNEGYGKAVGGTIGMAAGAAIGSIFGPGWGTAIGGMAGEWLGNKVGGFVGKNFNNAKDFLFGKKSTKTAEEEAQDEYEISKFGQISLNDSDIKEKAALATVKMHDIMISMYHHMTGKASNGEEINKGLLGGVAETATDIVTAPLKITSSIIGAGMNLITSPIKAIASVGQKTFIRETSEEKTNNNTINGDLNLNISGSIKLEVPNISAPNSFNLDISSLINTPSFRNQIMDIVRDEFVRVNGQKLRDSRMGIKGNNMI